MDDNLICPCCHEHYFEFEDNYEICPVCGWNDDLVQREMPDYRGGANKKSLNEYKADWEKKNVSQSTKVAV